MRKLATFAFCAVFVATSLSAQTAAIRANGLIQSEKDGFRFPDGTIQTTAASAVATLKRTIIVSPVPGNPTASGTALLAALASITGNDASNPWLLKIEPGIYDIGAIEFQMKSYVDVEGSGENTTVVRGARGTIGTIPTFGIIRGAADAQLRQLTIVNNAPAGSHGIALYVSDVSDFSVRDTTVVCNARLATGITVANSRVEASRVQVFANGTSGGSAVGVVSDGTTWMSFAGDITADGSAGASVATGVTVNGSSNETIISESRVLILGPTETSYGVRVLSGIARIRGSALLVSSGTDRYGVATAATLHAVATIHHSRIVIGNVWNDPGVGALNGGKGSVLRLYSSYVDGPRIGEALCVYAFTAEGTTTCPEPAP